MLYNYRFIFADSFYMDMDDGVVMFAMPEGAAVPDLDLSSPTSEVSAPVRRSFFPETWLWDLTVR